MPSRDARQKMLDAVEKATRGHVGMYNGFGQYMGACACGLECNAVELIDHIDEIGGAASVFDAVKAAGYVPATEEAFKESDEARKAIERSERLRVTNPAVGVTVSETKVLDLMADLERAPSDANTADQSRSLRPVSPSSSPVTK